MKKTNQKGYLPDAKQVKISAFFLTLEKPTEMHGDKRLKSKTVPYMETSENREPEMKKDILTLKRHSSKTEMDSDGKCSNKTRSPLQVSNNCVTEINPVSENNCISDNLKTVIKTNSSELNFILPTPENIVLENKTRKVNMRRMKRKLSFLECNNVERKDMFSKCRLKYDLDRSESDTLSVMVNAQRKEPEVKHMNILPKKCSQDEALISDECINSFNKCLNKRGSDTNDVNTCEINTKDMECETSDPQAENMHVSDKIECTLITCGQHNVSDTNGSNNNVQLDLVETISKTHVADVGQNDCIKSTINKVSVTSQIAETDAKVNISETFRSRMRNGVMLDMPIHCNVISIERLTEEVLLNVQACYADNVSLTCLLRGTWMNIKINIGDNVLITATNVSVSEPKYWIIDNDSGSIILYPDFLISGTSVVSSLFCMRRSVLSSMFCGPDADSRSMVIGILLHQILQKVLKQQIKLVEEIYKIVTDILLTSETLFSLYASRMSMEETKKELEAFVPCIHSFVQTYVYPKRTIDCLEVQNPNTWEGEITSVPDIEENIWVPTLGLKGRVDATVKARIYSKEKLMPLELKTGKASFSAEHCGQVILYTMMMKELGYSVESGLLLYLREGLMKEIKAGRSEYRDLISLRNEYVYYLQESQKIIFGDNGGRIVSPLLPEPINHHSACIKCPYLTVCSSALIDNGLDLLPKNNLLSSLSRKATSHLKKEHIDYIFHWTGLLQMELKEVQHTGSKLSYIWRLSPTEREENGNCLANVTQIGTVIEISAGHYEHVFFSVNMSKCSFVEGDYLIVSTHTRAGVAAGSVICICNNYITLDLERDLSGKGDNWHLDKYISPSLHIFNISNLGFLLDDNEQAARLRQAIILLELPTYASKLSSKILKLGKDLLQPLNSGQKSAIFKALAADHYVLFKGMPGTGKTATVVCLILIAVRLSFSILITSHTHSAIDNILLRLKGHVDFIRLGSSHRIHRDLMQYSEEKHNCSNPAELNKFYNSKPIVAVTCFGCKHPLLRQRQFDICIVDEATQVLQPAVLRALFSAKKFILVGDPDQMPPLVRSIEASKRGLAESLFVRLDRPAVTAVLNEQYRMNETITCLANRLSYNGKLKCANDSISKATVQIHKQLNYASWLDTVISSEIEDSVVVLDTGVCDSAYCINEKEVDIVLKILTAYRQGGIADNQIGIIAPYRTQVLLLRNAQKDADFCVEVNTVDQYQGRDKDIILYSCTQSDKTKVKEACILGDKNRMTVAITRAKHKLIIIGSVQTLQCYSIFQKLFHSIPQSKMLSVV